MLFFAEFRNILHFPLFPNFPREIQIQSRISAGNKMCGKLTTLFAIQLSFKRESNGNGGLTKN